MEGEETVTCLSAKEIKALVKPLFAAEPEKYYPVKTFESLGFSRSKCPKCQEHFWRHNLKQVTCGDSNCEGEYTFIGNGYGKGKKMTYAEAWQGAEQSFTTARVPCTAIERYPIVARWRNDVDFVAAGIFCFQPYCVTGELDPPANPLICPQFCARFNDLDNIGLTGRHYSGFIMLGIQVFNAPNNYKFFKEEVIEFNVRWLHETLGVPLDDITFIGDVWCGGGNMGPSVEYFIKGMEVGNMVFIQYKTFHDGTFEELDIKVIDVGIGLERVCWIYNGSATSYMDTFLNAFEYLSKSLDITVNQEIWEKFGPFSCTLNVDEVDDLENVWKEIGEKIGKPVAEVKAAVEPVKELYIILDHTRTILITISDGALPSNVGGGGNVRNILRRVFSIMKKNGWWDKVGMEGFLNIFELHKKDLEGIYGKFPEYKSFAQIIQVEYERWQTSDEESVKKLEKMLKTKKGKLGIDDWITAMQAHGIPADKIAEVAKAPIPGGLYYEIALRLEKTAKKQEKILYSTIHLAETDNIYYTDSQCMEFDGNILEVFANVTQKNIPNILILDRSAVYPTSGGQQHDNAVLTIEGEATPYNVVDAIKVGKCVLHILDRPVEGDLESFKGKKVHVNIDHERRRQLQAHHTGTHIVFAACRSVLGPHVWQNGAKKTTEMAHLDITHFKSLTKEEEGLIENTANRTINNCHSINKSFMDKAEAEKQYGFHLYQGGVVPGNSLRVVNIEGVDTEACCGTHCDSTAEVGWIKIVKTQRISDGIVRLYYVAYEKAIAKMNEEQGIMNSLCETWGVDQTQVLPTATRFFSEYKRLSTLTSKQDQQILNLQVKYVLNSNEVSFHYVKSDAPSPTIYFSFLPQFAAKLKEQNKGIIFLGSNFVLGLVGNNTSGDMVKEVEEICKKHSSKPVKSNIKDNVKFDFKIKGQKAVVTKEICQFNITGADFKQDEIAAVLQKFKVAEME